jgi:small-conductance mechanosensitive channel
MVNLLVRWLIFLHVLAALTFFLAHGTSAAMALKVRKETDFVRIRAMLDLSESTIELMFVSFLAMGLTGVALPFFIHIWNKGWVWVSIFLMIFVFIWMVWMSEREYKILRKLIGLPYRQGSKEYPAESPSSVEEVVAQLKKMNVTSLLIVGYLIPAFVLWLMIFKPF